MSKPFLDWAGKAERLSHDVLTRLTKSGHCAESLLIGAGGMTSPSCSTETVES
jgi:hypothetical protein